MIRQTVPYGNNAASKIIFPYVVMTAIHINIISISHSLQKTNNAYSLSDTVFVNVQKLQKNNANCAITVDLSGDFCDIAWNRVGNVCNR